MKRVGFRTPHVVPELPASAEELFREDGEKVYLLAGTLFFASVYSFAALFDPREDPEDVIVDFFETRVLDHSGLNAIDSLGVKYKRLGKNLRLRHLRQDCKALLERAGDMVEVSVIEDPLYGVAVDYGARFDHEA